MKYKKCIGTNKDGDPCGAMALPDSQYCQFHDPRIEAERIEWRAKGGRASSNKARARRALQDAAPRTLDDIEQLLREAMVSVLEGKLAANRAMALAALAREIRETRKANDLDRRLAAIEASDEGRRPA